MSFAHLSLSPTLQPCFDTALAKAGHHTPTPIQQQAIPAMLAGRDLIAMAQTGSGKTLAYALPLLQQRMQAPDQAPRVLGGLILVPTRELAAQVEQSLLQLAAHLPRRLKIVAATGGSSINPQLMALRGGADIVVATPGRLLDLVEHNALQLGTVATLVLDEADRLLDLGFGAELERILALLPAQRQSVLFSTTFPPAITVLAKRRLRDPLRITIAATPEQARRSSSAPSPWTPACAPSWCGSCCKTTAGRSCWCSSPAGTPLKKSPRSWKKPASPHCRCMVT